MATLTDLVSINGVTLSSLSLAGQIAVNEQDGEQTAPMRNVIETLTRPGGASLIGLVAQEARELRAYITIDSNAERISALNLFGAPLTVEPLTIVAKVGDPASLVNASIDAYLTEISYSPGQVKATLLAPDPVWTATSQSSDTSNVIASSGDPIGFTVGGEVKTFAEFRIDPSTQRSSFSATVGMRYRKQVTITNNGTRPMTRETVCVDLGDTAALVTASKMQSNGADVHVRFAGKDLPRELANMNTTRTFVYFAVTIPDGQSATYDIVYGNASATAPHGLGAFASARTNPDRYSALDLGSYSGTATSGGSNTITDTGAAHTVNRWAGGYCQILSGTGSGQRRRILSNTSTAITVTRNWGTNPDNTSVYIFWKSGIAVDGGVVSTNGTTTITTDSSQTWGVNMWKGGTIWNVTTGENAAITSNTATAITHGSMTAATTNDVYYIERQGVHCYYVDQVNHAERWRGGWNQSTRFTRPSAVMFAEDGIANAWNRTLLHKNNDRYNQSRTMPIDVGGGTIHYFPSLDCDRAVGGGNRLSEQGVADGVTIYHPHGYTAIYFDYALKNPNGICEFVVKAREEGGEEWTDVVTDSTTYASLTDVADQWADLTTYGTPLHLYMGLLPEDGVEVPATAAKSDVATARWLDRLELFVDVTNWTVGAVTAEVEIYDLQCVIYSTSIPTTDPHYEIRIGGDGHWCHVPLASTTNLTIKTDPASNEPIFTIGGTRAEWAGVIVYLDDDMDGNLVAVQTREFFPLPPATYSLPVEETDMGQLTIGVYWYERYIL